VKVRTRSSAIIGTLCLVASLALTTASADELAGPGQAPNVVLTTVATAQNPIAATPGPGDTLWIAERAGKVRVLDRGALGTPVLDISGSTTTDSERGLLGLAFDRDFTHLYISYTNREGTSTIDEYAVLEGRPQPATRRTVLTQTQPFANHNGGDIKTGPDGYLYIAFGDGGSAGDPQGNGQKLDTLLGKILRIDPRGGTPYAIPADNPFAGRPGAKGEIWAYGLRNPWRFSFDSATKDLLIGDVGQGTWEEIDWAPASSKGGENYGWSQMEGNHPYQGRTAPAGHVPPVHEYGHTGGACSVTGGYVYRGAAIPALQGQYLFSDYCDGTVRSLTMSNGKVTAVNSLGVNGGNVVSFAQGADGELYVIALNGRVSRIDPV